MVSSIDFKIYSTDGKSFKDTVDEIYLDVPSSGVIGLTPNHTPYSAMLHIGTFYTVKNGVKTSFAVSSGTINFKNGEAVILAQTFEREDELDRERIKKAREKALKTLENIDKIDKITYDNASFSLKKAINRLKILK